MGLNALGFPDIEAFLYKTSNQSTTKSVAANVTWDTALFDTAGFFDSAVSNTNITIPIGGVYFVICSIEWEAGATGYRQHTLRLSDNTNLMRYNNLPVTAGGVQSHIVLSGVGRFNAGDVVYLEVEQTDKTPFLLQGGDQWDTSFYIRLLSLTEAS